MSGIALTGGANPFASNKREEIDSNSTNETSSSSMADSLKGAASGVGNTVSSGASQVSSGAQQAGGQVSSGAQQVGSTASSGAQQAASTASDGAEKVNPMSSGSSGTQDWEAMTEEQKKATYDALPEDQKHSQGYYEWIKQGLYNKKENWMPWIEDQYLRWFTSDNKASYATKGGLDKTKVTGVEQVDTLQDGLNNTVAGQVGKGGLLQPVGDMASSEGINRAERGGKDDSGNYTGAAAGSGVTGTLSSAGGSVWGGAKSAGGYVGSFLPGSGGKKEGAAE